MLVSKKEHDRHRIIQLIHLLEVRHLVQITDVYDSEILDTFGDAEEHFVLPHTVGIPVAPEADDYEALFFAHDCLVDVPAGVEMGNYDGTHGMLLRIFEGNDGRKVARVVCMQIAVE